MKIQWLLVPALMIGACRTPAGTKENKEMAKPATAEQPSVILQKIVGRDDPKIDDKPAQIFDCSIKSNEIKDLEAVKKLIVEAEASELIVAHHIMQTIPSLEIYAFNAKGNKVTLVYNSTNYEHRTDAATDKLIALAHEKCPTPEGFTKKKRS